MERNIKMNTFDKACASFSIVSGAVFMIVGALGLFGGSEASFTLPPGLGVLPFFLGWGMCIPLVKFWRLTNQETESANDPI